ncbi:NACHT domain-containing protein [Lentzea sp. NPDC102401]|uniref:NACHT domain-containing protein n=1 Tax=Lentzea sp. NPDC102401 TaxID=3364128 RepID=UPI003830E06B
MASRSARISLFLAGTLPALAGLAAGHPVAAGFLFLGAELGIWALMLTGGVLDDLGKRWRNRVTEWLDQAVLRGTSRFGKRYREFLIDTLRAIEEQGPATSGFYRPDLDEVFVDVGLVTQAPHLVSPSLLADQQVIGVDRRNLDEFIDQEQPSVLAVIGAPGSGKSTLLRRTAREISRHRFRNRRTVPILLYLRDHTDIIVGNPDIDVATLVRRHLEVYRLEDPARWFERRLRAGKCVVLLDGLDEVADQKDRTVVSDWVSAQVARYPKNDYVLTSRPQGYLSSKVDNALVLQVRSFSDEQVTDFVRRWYFAVERRASRSESVDVRRAAEIAANDLLDRLYRNPALYELTVNPLLLTMIANVHRHRGALPGSRADLYKEICEVMLWRRQVAKKMELELRGDKKESLLRSLAFGMMEKRVTGVPRADVVEAIKPSMRRLSRDFTVDGFLSDVTTNGLLVERESGVYSFAHHTFQEYLAAAHIRDKQWSKILVDGVDDVWWRETTLLYAAWSDADEIVQACLDSSSVAAFQLAYDCAGQGSELAPELVERMDALLAEVYEPDTPAERRRLMAGVLAARHVHGLVRTRGRRWVCSKPITSGIFWLYQQDVRAEQAVNAVPGGTDPVRGVWGGDALAFTRWINSITGNHIVYQLPEHDDVKDVFDRAPDFTVWLRPTAKAKQPKLWVPKGVAHPHSVNSEMLASHVIGDATRVAPSLARLLLLQSLLEVRVLAENLEGELAQARANAMARGRTRELEIAAAAAHARSLAKDRPLRLAQALEGARDLAAALGLESAAAVTIEVVKAIAYANKADRAAAIARADRLADDLVDELDPDFARIFVLTGKSSARKSPDRVMGRALCKVFDTLLFKQPSPETWATEFSTAFLHHTLDFQQKPIVVSPGALADSTHHARRVLIDVAGVSASEEDEDEDVYEGPSAWASQAVFALEDVAVPIFERKRDLTPDTATAIRLASLCLAAETPTLRTGVLSQTFRQIAAGVSLLERRMDGQAVCNETIMLSVS